MDPDDTNDRDEAFHRLLLQTSVMLRGARDADKVLRHMLRAMSRVLGADAACVAARGHGDDRVRMAVALPHEADWDLGFLDDVLADRQPAFPRGTICSKLHRRGRPWGVIAMRRDAGRFAEWQERAIGTVAVEASDLIGRIDRERLTEVRARIDGKIMRELAPLDLTYQILDGLHQLTGYDHSAAFYAHEPEAGTLRLVAEQIAWRKLKSDRIGAVVEVGAAIEPLLHGGDVFGFDRRDGWREWTDRGAAALATLLDRPAEGAEADGGAPRVDAMLCAPIGGSAPGLLVLAARHAGAFADYERNIVARFSPMVSLVLQRARTLESLRDRMVTIERRTTLAHLARGVAHDINNALGAVVPLVQQIRSEIDAGAVDPATLRADIQRIEHSIEVCRRIFSGMLRFARGAARHDGTSDVRRAVLNAHSVLEEGLTRQGVRVTLDLPEELPEVRGGQEDLERLVLNLATNAREAMPRGGALRIGAAAADGEVRIVIEDTGRGIPAGMLRQIDQPFFSTKTDGWGLGLPTCRSIVSEIGGRMEIESETGAGTRVTVTLRPAAVAQAAVPAERS